MIQMIIDNVFNFENAIQGMRNALSSWDNSDSYKDGRRYVIGPKDLKLAQNLIYAGNDESKFLRQIFISMEISAPLYWWKEMDTYKIGTVANSTSTMHTLAKEPITKYMFSFDESLNDEKDVRFSMYKENIIAYCETLRQKYIETNDKDYWRALIQLLPESFMQLRTWTANYQVLRNIYFARRHHKLSEWRHFCDRIETLPYAKELICLEKEKNK